MVLSEDVPGWADLFRSDTAEQTAKTVCPAGKFSTAGGSASMWWNI
jgi:hypothetical protein